MAASSLLLRPRPRPPPPLPLHPKLQTSLDSNLMSFRFRRQLKPPGISASSSSNPSPSSSWDREEIRWLREEQRWLREEQRWIREESRWNSEREALLREIAALKLQIEALELEKTLQRTSVSDLVANLASLLQALKEADLKQAPNQIAESGSGPVPMMLEEAEMKGMIVKENRVTKSDRKEEVTVPYSDRKEEKLKKRASLRVGSEGEDVRVMQEALQRLGFYSGEEDMEYSSFSSGTERAVKTWQATLGTSEDGVMTAELLERLFMELEIVIAGSIVNRDQKGDSISTTVKDGENGAVASVTEIANFQHSVVKESGTDAEVSQHRVFLLGENRWEEPSRLVGRQKQIIGSNRGAAVKCLTCRGEGNLMCIECDGTGEPNIEPQFLEWVEEGTKCPYCEGLGYTSCDVCDGKGMVAA